MAITPVNAGFRRAALLAITASLAACAGQSAAPLGAPRPEAADIHTAAASSTLSFSAASYEVGERGPALAVTVNRTGSTSAAAGVSYATADGSAVAGRNYTKATGTLAFAPGQNSATFDVPVVENAPFSGARSFALALSQPTQGATLGAASATATIYSTFWVYNAGKFFWPGDYSYPYPGKNIFIDYADTAGRPLNGAYDISVKQVDGSWGAWQPYATADNFATTGYESLRFALKPTVANQTWSCQFLYVGDVPVGISVNVTDYGPAPQPGKWAVYTIPLAKLGVARSDIYKFAIQDQTGLEDNLWYVDGVGFVQ